MKRTGIFIFAAALALTIQDGSFENKMFINADIYRSEVRVATDEGVKTLTRNLSVSVAKPLDNDIDVAVVKSPELLDTYRKAWYDETAELLPDANCSLDGLSTVLRKGDVTSKDIELTFTGLDKLDYSKVCASCHYRSEWSRGARESQDNVLRSERSISRKCSC